MSATMQANRFIQQRYDAHLADVSAFPGRASYAG